MSELLLTGWYWNPVVVLALAMVTAGYAYAFFHFHRRGWLPQLTARGLVLRRHPWCFAAGLLILVVALLSPIHTLADRFFMAHMLQHILLIMVAPPLILLGLPAPLVRWLILELKLRTTLNWLTSPVVAYVVYNVNLLVWHLPALYQSALRNAFVHDLEHALFYYTALFFWWRVIDPTAGWFPFWRWPPAKWLYLLISAPPSYVLGSIFWASDRILYPYYELFPRFWGPSPLWDQRYGGMLMWIQGWMFVMASMLVFFLWYDPEQAAGALEGEER